MTSADEADRGQVRRPARFIAPYAEIFRVPRAWRFCVAGIIGRMPIAMAGLGTVLLISAGTGRYGVAGSVSAAGSVGSAFATPQFARLADRYGQRRVLVPMVTVFAASAATLIAAVQLRAPTWAFFPPGAAAGATMPALGPMARARWSALLGGSPRLHAAFSLESVADELCFVVGPAAVTILATEVHPAAGLGAAVVLCLTGTLWFAAQRGTEPPGRGRLAPAPAADVITAARQGHTERTPGSPRGDHPLLAAPGLTVLVPVYLFLGGMFVSVDLSTVGFAAHFGHKPLSGLILGTYALGSATGGLWYGTRNWKAPASRRFTLTLTATVAGVCSFWAMPGLPLLVPVIYLCGLTIAPTLIAGYSLLEAQALPGRTTEAMSWLSSGIGIGVAGGATAAGFILDAFGPRWGYAFAACCGCVAVLITLCFPGGLRSREGAPVPPRPPGRCPGSHRYTGLAGRDPRCLRVPPRLAGPAPGAPRRRSLRRAGPPSVTCGFRRCHGPA